MKSTTNVHDVDPECVAVKAHQHPDPYAFGTVEIIVNGYSVTLFADGPDGAQRLLAALDKQLVGATIAGA